MKQLSVLSIALIIFLLHYNTGYCQWVHTPDYFSGGSIRSLEVNGINLFAGTEFGVYLSTDNGATWAAVNNGLPATLIWSLEVSGNNLYACTGGLGLFRTTDNGASWTNLGLVSELIYTCVVKGTTIFAGTGDHGIYRSTDDGTTWVQVNNGLTWLHVKALFVNGNSIFAGTHPSIFRSTDDGENWVELTNGLPNPPVNDYGFTMIGSTLFAGIDSGVYYSTDNGNSWNPTNLTGAFVYTIYAYLNNLFAGHSGYGVYHSSDNGLTWLYVNEGLPSEVYPQSIITSGDKIFLAASYEGLYWRPLSELVSSVPGSGKDVPTDYSLFQNYSNPFNPTTTIKYQILELGFVTLKVFDVLGNELETLVNEEKPTGTYEVEFDGTGLTSGIYFYKLQAGSYVETKKMILLK